MKIKRPEPPPLPELKKGSLLVLKVPPYYAKEYLYEVTSAGDKLIRATLYHSPTVKKQWTLEEFRALFDNKIIRLAEEKDVQSMTTSDARKHD
ncbi:MAG TPA: hypothetical protein V6D22_04425 [Candidatus Obscuribacterales bacterium]